MIITFHVSHSQPGYKYYYSPTQFSVAIDCGASVSLEPSWYHSLFSECGSMASLIASVHRPGPWTLPGPVQPVTLDRLFPENLLFGQANIFMKKLTNHLLGHD